MEACLRILTRILKVLRDELKSYRKVLVTILRMHAVILFLYSNAFCHAEPSLESYLELIHAHPHLKLLGNHLKNEIEIVIDEDEMKKIQENEYQRHIANGIHADLAYEWSKPGVIASDPYLLWVRDPVIFPKGHTGLYKRIIWKCTLNGEQPIAILPLTNEGKIVLIKTWRHATGTWEFEIPRGAPLEFEEPYATAIRELKEETGFCTSVIKQVGIINPDSGVLSSQVAVFVAIGELQADAKTDEDEVIAGVYTFSLTDLENYIIQGYIDIQEKEGRSRVYLRDPFLTYALYQIKLRRMF